jgi:hypothetical protein
MHCVFVDSADPGKTDSGNDSAKSKFKSSAIFDQIEATLKSDGETLVNKVKGVFAFKVKVSNVNAMAHFIKEKFVPILMECTIKYSYGKLTQYKLSVGQQQSPDHALPLNMIFHWHCPLAGLFFIY